MALTPTNATYTPSNARIATKSNYISTLDLHKPDRSEDFIKRYGSQNLTGLLEMMGAKAPTTQQTFTHYEEEYIHNYLEVSADVTGDTAAAKTIDVKIVAAVDTPDDGSATHRTAARLGDIVMLTDGSLAQVVGLRTHTGSALVNGVSVDGFAVPFAPGAAAVESIKLAFYDDANGSLALADGDLLPIIGNEFAEATGQPDGLTPKAKKVDNTVMIMKESFEVSGSEATNVVYVKVQGADGKEGYLWYLKGEADTYRRMQNYCEMTMLLGEQATGDLSSNGMSGTLGLIPNIKANGTQLDPGTFGDYGTDDIDDMVKAIDRERGAKENMLFCGIELSLKLDDVIAGFNAGTTASAFKFGHFNMGDTADFGYTKFNRGGYTFNKSIYDPFSYTGMLGSASGQNWGRVGFTVPMDTQRDGNGDAVPSMRIRYKEAGPYSREMEHWFTGSAVLQDKTDDVDNLKCHYRTERGLEVFGANRFVYIEA